MNKTVVKHRGIIVFALMSATLMQALDTTIVNVALPHMQGSLSAAPDQISWVLTSYLVASAIMMPLTGYFADRLGRKNYLLWCICGFTLTSALCGAANSLAMLVSCRLLQGIFGAALVPLSQAILMDVYPHEELGKAMAIWGTGVMVGPVLGPTLGGYLTEVANWRWTFYINIPVGIMAVLFVWKFVPDVAKKLRNFDWIGFILIALAIGATQYFVDCGNQKDWFSARSIQIAAISAVIGYIGFVSYSLYKRGHTVFNIAVFKNTNFVISNLMMLISGIGLFGSMVVQPLLLESLLNYPVRDAGLMMTPRAISMMISMTIVGKIVHRVDPRLFIVCGIITSAIGVYSCTYYSLEVSTIWLIWPMIVQGIGLGMIFVPLMVIAFATLPKALRVEAAGLSSLMRMLGASTGIAITLTVYTRNIQTAWNNLIGFVQPYNQALNHYVSKIAAAHLSASSTVGVVAKELIMQAQILAIVNVFAFIAWSFLIMLPFVLLMKYRKNRESNT
jgi:MFS transporter, DHA2 family, multidrug resistance protein